jgi:putative hydrolases of HD superfamily
MEALSQKQMEKMLDFFIEVGKLKRMPRRGWVINQIKNPESIAEHIFRATLMGWLMAEGKRFNVEKLLKIALVHDLCEVYAGDTTPYDSVLPKDKKKLKALMKTWPRFTPEEKEQRAKQKHINEKAGLSKLIFNLPARAKKEVMDLWMEYEKGVSKEGRFFRQADRMENFLQAYEYWRKDKNPPMGPWWLWAREFFDEPTLVRFMDFLEKKFHKKKTNRLP